MNGNFGKTTLWMYNYEGEGDSFVPPNRISVVDTVCLVVAEAPLMPLAMSFMAHERLPSGLRSDYRGDQVAVY